MDMYLYGKTNVEQYVLISRDHFFFTYRKRTSALHDAAPHANIRWTLFHTSRGRQRQYHLAETGMPDSTEDILVLWWKDD